MAHSVLVVEDDRDLARNLVDYLDLRGYATDYAPDGFAAINRLQSGHYDLVILDLMLPGIDGIAVCHRLRHELMKRTPVIMLTAKDDVDVKVSAFDFGADDYIVKPVALKELEARARALIRRANSEGDSPVLVVGDLRLDTGTLRVERAGQPISMPPVQLRLLALLMKHAPNVVSQQAITREIWGEEAGDKHSMVVHMHALRTAIDKPFDKQLIHTVRGFGYRIALANESL